MVYIVAPRLLALMAMQLNTTGISTEEQLSYPFTVLPLCFNKEVCQYIEFQTAPQTAPC